MPPKALIVTDGKIGDLVQCRGVAQAMGLAADELVVTLPPPYSWFAPRLGVDRRTREVAHDVGDTDVVIASGRRAAPMLRAIKMAPGVDSFTILLKDARQGARLADFIWVPEHDPLRGANVMTTLTSPHILFEERIGAERTALPADIAELPRPIATVLLGGPSGRNRFSESNIDAFCAELTAFAADVGSVLLTPSRRTPLAFTDRVAAVLERSARPVRVWRGGDPNPYLSWMAAADVLVVTGDSVNMVGEAAAMGRPVLVHRPDALSPKIARFLDRMEETDAVVPLGGAWRSGPRPRVDATEDIAAEALRRYEAHRDALKDV